MDNNSKVAKSSSGSCQPSWWFSCDFSAEELIILRTSFAAVKNRLENVAIVAFTKLFDIRPDAFAVFVGKKVLPNTREEVQYSWETRQHGLRVLSIVERCLNRVDKSELFQEVVTNLASRHLSYGAKPVYLLALFGCLREALLNEMAAAEEDGLNGDRPLLLNDTLNLGVTTVNVTWSKFFRTLGLAFVSEMLALQDRYDPDLSTNNNGLATPATGSRSGSTSKSSRKS